MAVPMWFDRPEIFQLLTKRIENFLAGYRQNVALLGPEGMGKSTLLKRLVLQGLSIPSPVMIFYLEVREGEGLAEWVSRFVQTLLAQALKSKGLSELPIDYQGLVEVAAGRLPRSAALARRLSVLMENRGGEELYTEHWDLAHLVAEETGIPNLLLLDEFHRLGAFKVKDPFRRLGRNIMVQSSTMYLLASSSSLAARKILREGLNLLFGQFEIVEIGPLEESVCRSVIRRRHRMRPSDPFLEHLLIELVQGYPVFLDLLLKRGLSFQGEIDSEKEILRGLESLLLEPGGLLRVRFEQSLARIRSHPDRRHWIAVLVMVAGGLSRVSDLARALERTPAQIRRSLENLVESGLVIKTGIFYQVPERLFSLWLKAAYPLLQTGEIENSPRTHDSFEQGVGRWLRSIRESIHQPVEFHLVELIGRWRGERVEMEGRVIQLPFFDRVEIIQGPLQKPCVVAHRMGKRSGKGWFFIPWNGSLQEGQTRQLIEAVEESPFRYYRKILGGGYPIDIASRLLFQEASISVWDLAGLNQLLERYRLERIPFPGGPLPPLADAIALTADSPTLRASSETS